ncbi:MAG: DUF1573 domain-containing protein [Isosphaerales bacterium]
MARLPFGHRPKSKSSPGVKPATIEFRFFLTHSRVCQSSASVLGKAPIMETEQAIQRQVLPGIRGWAPSRPGALVVCAVSAPVVLAFWALGGFGAVGVAVALMKGETLFVDSSTKSFGVVPAGDPIVVSYKLTNRGDQNIRIVGCRAVCRCMVPEDLPFTLRPKESRNFPILIRNPKGEGGSRSQTINWGITLFTTNPAQAQIPLTVKGELRTRRQAPGPGS